MLLLMLCPQLTLLRVRRVHSFLALLLAMFRALADAPYSLAPPAHLPTHRPLRYTSDAPITPDLGFSEEEASSTQYDASMWAARHVDDHTDRWPTKGRQLDIRGKVAGLSPLRTRRSMV
ncbi:hypothetical protein LXA43DRAFT_193446 [Ganoderma leucocontextum]|nr:hypothetical protein LXA43DRAFT_193446 [Ganoderma leucocontextum]